MPLYGFYKIVYFIQKPLLITHLLDIKETEYVRLNRKQLVVPTRKFRQGKSAMQLKQPVNLIFLRLRPIAVTVQLNAARAACTRAMIRVGIHS